MNIALYIQKQIEWSGETFGYTERAEGICKHIEKELKEVRANPKDVLEWVDIVILALDGAWRAGYTPKEVEAALKTKQAINRLRFYPKPVSDEECSEHVR